MSAWETFRRSLRRREPSTPWLSPEDTYGSAGRDVAEVTGRPRRLRPSWSKLGRRLAGPNAWQIADEANAGWGRAIALGERAVAERDAAERERQYALADRDKALRQRDAFAVEVDELRRERNLARSLVAASPEEAKRVCLDLSDRNAELRRDLNDLEKRFAELQRERAS